MRRVNAACIHYTECPSGPGAFGIDAVARRSRDIIDDRKSLTNQTVEERALADVRAADEGYEGFGHDDLLSESLVRLGASRHTRLRACLRTRIISAQA
jgi:hypothetical protein